MLTAKSQQHRFHRTILSIRSRCGRRARAIDRCDALWSLAVPSTGARREHDPLGASACRGSGRRQRHRIFAAGTEVPSAKREEIKSASASVLKPADLRSGCLAHRHELRIRYDSHHQQQQKQYDYDEFDPFPTRVREPSNHCVDHHWPLKLLIAAGLYLHWPGCQSIFIQIPPSTTGVLSLLSLPSK